MALQLIYHCHYQIDLGIPRAYNLFMSGKGDFYNLWQTQIKELFSVISDISIVIIFKEIPDH